MLAALAAAVAVAVVVAELLHRRFYGLLVVAFTAGLLFPVTFDIPDGLRSLHYVARAITRAGSAGGRGLVRSAALEPRLDRRPRGR